MNSIWKHPKLIYCSIWRGGTVKMIWQFLYIITKINWSVKDQKFVFCRIMHIQTHIKSVYLSSLMCFLLYYLQRGRLMDYILYWQRDAISSEKTKTHRKFILNSACNLWNVANPPPNITIIQLNQWVNALK